MQLERDVKRLEEQEQEPWEDGETQRLEDLISACVVCHSCIEASPNGCSYENGYNCDGKLPKPLQKSYTHISGMSSVLLQVFQQT